MPWSTEVRTYGRPRVTLTPSPNDSAFSTGSPWSWYIATIASDAAIRSGTNTVSAGSGPMTRRPRCRASAIAGAMTSISSRPRWPSSPACGLRPQTARRGASMPNRDSSSAATMASVSATASRVIAAGTADSGRCVVTSATRSGCGPAPPTSIITTRGVPARRAKNSVWPENGMPAPVSALFCTGAVTSASKRPVAQASAAAPSIARSNRRWSCPGVPAPPVPRAGGARLRTRLRPARTTRDRSRRNAARGRSAGRAAAGGRGRRRSRGGRETARARGARRSSRTVRGRSRRARPG